MKILKQAVKALKKKPMTEKYPVKNKRVYEGFRGKIEYDKKKCIGDFSCIRFCPVTAILATPEKKVKFDMGKCVLCGLCEDVCPTKAIHLGKVFAFDTDDAEELWVK